MRVIVNGTPRDLPPGAKVADALTAVGVERSERGVAVAVDAGVVPRAQWHAMPLEEGMAVEVLRATAGG